MPDEPKETQPLLKDILEEMRSGFARMEARFDRIEARLDKIEKRLERFERKFDVLTADIVDLRERISDIERMPKLKRIE